MVAVETDRLQAAIEEFLNQLRVERGLSDATLTAYRADLLDFAASRGASATWDASPKTSVRYLTMLGSPGGSRRTALRASESGASGCCLPRYKICSPVASRDSA